MHTASFYAQKYNSDSVYIKFDTTPVIPFMVDSIIDKRTYLKENMLRISERKKYLYIPVDFFYLIDEPLSEKIKKTFKNETTLNIKLQLEIERFELTYSELKPLPMLVAQIKVFEQTENGKEYIGTLVYETLGKKPKKKMENEAFETLIQSWVNIFSSDLQKIIKNDSVKKPLNYYSQEFMPQQRIFSKAVYLWQINSYCIEGNIAFFDPEPGKRFRRQNSFILYRNDVRFESISFGRNSYMKIFRLSPDWVAAAEFRYGLGVNRWKDFNTYNHTLYDIVNFTVGIKGGFYYYPFAKRSLFAGFLANTDLIYIYSMNFFGRYGIGISLGLNF